MKTPYDAALRVADRRLERVRVAIGRAVGELARAQAAQDHGARVLRRECLLAADDWRLTTEHYFLRARDEHARLTAERDASRARLEDLRRKAVVCYGERAAIDEAVSRHHAEAAQAEAAAEQATLDDLSAARLARRRHRPRVTAAVSAP